MATRITTEQLSARLAEILELVHSRSERFVVERDGQPVATVAPVPAQPSITWGEFIALLRELPPTDPEFADDLEAIQASQPLAELTEWPD